MNALVLLSGGLDSATLLAEAVRDRVDPIAALFVDYGQRHIREERSSQWLAAHYGVPWSRLDLRTFGAAVSSALTDPGADVPHGHYGAENMAATVVPGRNATMLAAAAGIAASRGLSTVLTAVHAGDHPIYPDCRPEFIEALSAALDLGCGVRVLAPFAECDKATIVWLAERIGVPFGSTWSCYEGGRRHCGRCGTCVERAEAFARAGVDDPTDYADPDYWRQAVTA